MNQFYPREAKKDFLYTKMAALLLAFAVAGFFAVWSFQQGAEYGLISLSPEKSPGRITGIEEGERAIRFKFEYQDGRLNRYSGDFLQKNYGPAGRQIGLTSQLRTGDDVDVVYLSFYPQVAQMEKQLSNQAVSFYFLVFSFLVHIATTTLGLQTIRQINAHASEDSYY